MKEIYVLRLGHRPARDKRVTTHVALVARAFGARGIYIEGKDEKVVDSIRKILNNWGGSSYFIVKEIKSGKKLVEEWKRKGGTVIHLTMYGINIDDLKNEIEKIKYPLLLIVGSEKVEGWYYHNADYNIAIGNQPHSEVAALAIFLDRIYKGRELYMEFGDAKIKIIPQKAGKKVIRNG
ncbi:tRNA (cytidine(56)-2'-O)-methyltransferase [Sulfolobus tengchongensis]|uniref:tRNA (cytidine(56)-2'-O)-methyltransferase n=1 Tax=Sulfolobus tengchongensis TaxID=207809 RepID=A0AAX4L4E8_9CREN